MANIIGWIGSICFLLSGFPQAWECFREKHAHGLNSLFLLFWLAGELCLIAATLGRFGWVNWLMLSYISGVLCVLIILYYKLFPKRKKMAWICNKHNYGVSPEQCPECLQAEIKWLRRGITELDIRLLLGCYLANQDNGEWWFFDENGEGLFGGTDSIIDIIEELARDKTRLKLYD